jgi:hypothetical protein
LLFFLALEPLRELDALAFFLGLRVGREAFLTVKLEALGPDLQFPELNETNRATSPISYTDRTRCRM